MLKKILNKIGFYKVYKIKLSGKIVRIPIFNKLGFSNLNLAEPWMQTVLKKIGSNDKAFLDVGVNVGQTLIRWKSEFPNSTYVGVEPNTDCVYYVNQLISLNQFHNSIILPFGLGNKIQINNLYISKTDPSDSTASSIENFRNKNGRKAIPIVTLPFQFMSNTNFDIIKIDVEGGELEVIQSIFDTKKCRQIFICEILPVYNKNNKERLERQKKIESILHQHDYTILRIIKGKNVSLQRISEFGIHSDLEQCDYLFIPKSKEKEITAKFE